MYKYGYARLMPFLIAKGRVKISKIMEPYIETVIRCHTDGILFSEEPKGIVYGNNLGELVNEGFKKHTQINISGNIIYK